MGSASPSTGGVSPGEGRSAQGRGVATGGGDGPAGRPNESRQASHCCSALCRNPSAHFCAHGLPQTPEQGRPRKLVSYERDGPARAASPGPLLCTRLPSWPTRGGRGERGASKADQGRFVQPMPANPKPQGLDATPLLFAHVF